MAKSTDSAVDLERTTPNVLTSRSPRATPFAVAAASIVSVCVPTDSVGSGTVTSTNAVPRTCVDAIPSEGAATVKVTGSAALRADPNARNRMMG